MAQNSKPRDGQTPTPPRIDWSVIYPPFPLGNPAAFGHGQKGAE